MSAVASEAAYPLDWSALDIRRTLDLIPLGDDRFQSSCNEDNGRWFIFGGQMLGQSLAAAAATVAAGREAQSLHLTFSRPARPDIPVVYEVERLGDGRTTSTRRVRAMQGSKIACEVVASFQVPAFAAIEHQDSPGPDVIPPESLIPLDVLIERHPELGVHQLSTVAPKSSAEVRLVHPERYLAGGSDSWQFWVRPRHKLGDAAWLHHCTVAYMTDYALAFAAVVPTLPLSATSDMLMASVNHTLWFYGTYRADDWMLVDATSPVAAVGRALIVGKIYDRSGRLVAATALEGVFGPKAAASTEKGG